MAETVGRVDIIADIDGRALDRQVKALGNKIGRQLGKRMSDGASKELSKLGDELEADMKKHGEFAGISFTNSMQRILRSRLGGITDDIAKAFSGKDTLRKYVDELGGVEDGSKKVREQLIEMNEAGTLSDKMFNRLMGTLAQSQGAWRSQTREAEAAKVELEELEVAVNRFVNSQREMELNANLDALALRRQTEAAKAATKDIDELALAMDRNTKASDRSTSSLDRQTSAWKRLPHGARQFLFYTGLFAAMGEEIAILGSAAGSSLTVLAGAAGAAGIGIGTTVAAFQDLTGEISELPAEVQPAAAAFQSIGDAFAEMQDRIQIAALSNAEGAFASLRSTVEALTPAFEIVGAAVGRVLDTFAASLAPGTAGFDNLFRLVEASAPVFETLASAAFTFGEALGNVFVASIPYVEIFAGWLNELATDFLNWTNSIEGQNALEEFFNNGLTIMQAIEPLIAAVAGALNDLVTPETIADFVTFLDSLTQFIPILGEILGVIGDLNILNLFAEILLVIGEAIEPIIPELSEMATILGEGLITAVQGLLPFLEAFFVALGPLLPVLAQMASDLLVALIPAVTALAPLFAPLSEAILAVLVAITPLIPVIADLVVTLITGLVPILLPVIQLMADLFERIAPLMPLIVDLISAALTPLYIAFDLVLPVLGKLIELIIKIFDPIAALMAPVLDLIGGWDGLDGAMGDFRDTIGGWADGVIGAIDDVIGWIEDAIGWFNSLFDASAKSPSPGSGGGGGGGGGGMASGGVVTYGARRLIGEDGPEAVVPLDRPLSMVDPSVRALSAVAQGIDGGIGGGGGKIVNVHPGAITIQTVAPPVQVANMVLDRLVAGAMV